MSRILKKWTEPARVARVMASTGCDEAAAKEYLIAEEGDEWDAIDSFNGDHRHAVITNQAEFFLKRLATYLDPGAPVTDAAIEAAGRRVLENDRRLVAKVCSDREFADAASKHLAGAIYDRINGDRK